MAELAHKTNGRPKGTFYGDDQGTWRYTDGYPLGLRREGWDWSASIALSLTNDWKNMSVDGATEHHRGFRKALHQIVREYPEVAYFVLQFDGPWIPVSKLVSVPSGPSIDLGKLVWYHGTSDDVLDAILRQGLQPRSKTNLAPAYGAEFGAQSGRVDGIYLTTQETMAHSAARSAARQRGGSPVVLEVRGLRHAQFRADEDSRETDPVKSLERMGSVAYIGSIPSKNVKVHARMDGGRWVKASSCDGIPSARKPRQARFNFSEKVLKQWQSDLRRMTKIYRSVPDDAARVWQYDHYEDNPNYRKSLTMWEEAKKLFITFRANIHDTVYEEMLPGSEKEKTWQERMLREKAWVFLSDITTPSMFPESWDYRTDTHLPDLPKLGQVRDTVVRRYQKSAREFFEALDEWLQMQGGSYSSNRVEQVTLSGFKVRIYDGEGKEGYIKNVRDGLDQYRKRAQKYAPILLQHQVPIQVFPQKDSGNAEASYDFGTKTISLWSWATYASSSLSRMVWVLAHEMGHHVYKTVLNSRQRDFWERAIKGDYKELDLRDVMKRMRSGEEVLSFSARIEKEDPLLSLKLSTLWYHPRYQFRNLLTISDIHRYLNEGGDPVVEVPATPISGYASKNAEEAFCEAIGILVGLGPRGLHQKIRGLLRTLLPDLRVASERTSRIQIATRELIVRMASGKTASFRLSAVDQRVIRAFIDREAQEGKLLSTDGTSLRKHGMGGEKVAVWRGSKIAVVSTESAASDQSIIRYLVKAAGKGMVTFSYERDGHKMSVRYEAHSDAVDRYQMRTTIAAYAANGDVMGYVTYDYYPYDDGKGNYAVSTVEVRPEYRRSGVATGLYREMFRRERISKRDLRPSYQTEDGYNFRSRAILASKDMLYHATAPTRLSSIMSKGLRSDGDSMRGTPAQRGVSLSTKLSALKGGDFGSLILGVSRSALRGLDLVDADFWGDGREAEVRAVDLRRDVTVIPSSAIKQLIFLRSPRKFELDWLEKEYDLPIYVLDGSSLKDLSNRVALAKRVAQAHTAAADMQALAYAQAWLSRHSKPLDRNVEVYISPTGSEAKVNIIREFRGKPLIDSLITHLEEKGIQTTAHKGIACPGGWHVAKPVFYENS